MIAGFEESEAFATTSSVAKELVRQLPTWIAIYVLLAVMIGVLSRSSDGTPSIGLAVGGAAVVMALLLAGLGAMTRARLRKTRLVLGPDGLSRTDHLATVSIAWADVERIDRVAIFQTGVSPAKSPGASLLTAVTNPLERRRIESVVGVGVLTPAETTLPGAVRAMEEHHRRLGHGRNGQTLRPVALSEFDPDWRTGRIGAWVRAHRPDLLA